MAKKFEASVTPALLKWARESFNLPLEEAAKKVKVKQQRLLEWERGKDRPTFNQLMKLSKAYKRPVSVFYLAEVPSEDEPFAETNIADLRKFGSSEHQPWPPELILELRKANFRRESYLELSELLQEKVADFTLRRERSESAESLAKRIRSTLAITPEQQFQWKDITVAYRNWRRAIEQQQILICQTGYYMHKRPVSLEVLRGMAISLNPLPIILVNGQDAQAARIFTLFHELGHLLLRQSAMRNIYSGYHDSSEQFCNLFAGCLLVPEYALREQLDASENTQPQEWSNEIIRKMANRFSVSKEVIVRRLMDCRLATSEFYQRKRREYLAQTPKKQFGRGPFHRRYLNWNGEHYTRKVLEAYQESFITYLDVAIYLDTKVKFIEPIQNDLATPDFQ
ncbi:MAG: ImmA/IrrE family metallo-endopeptidase [Chloroflexi bacterium]|nr:ImmA/IrrE family metallo-endopeptidase [Chloroflexota bacterium]